MFNSDFYFSLDLILLSIARGTIYTIGITNGKDPNHQLVRLGTCETVIPKPDLQYISTYI